MSVSYNTKVTDAGLITFIRLFFRWKGSVWKAVYKELIFWLASYFLLNLVYRYLMNNEFQNEFEKICKFFRTYTDFVPLTFMLGFFVNLVVNRWWTMWTNIGWIDTPSLFINAYIPGNDERSRMFRRNIIRYLLFFQVLVFRDISTSIRLRFPTLETFVVAGYLTDFELVDYQNIVTSYKNYYTPIRWAMNLVRQARAENLVSNDFAVSELYKTIIDFRGKIGTLLSYDFQPIPLIYTVVVCLSVRLYFIAALLGRQIILSEKDEIDTFIPIMTIVQFVFYMGWMKVAEALLNPFGDDDDDFECNWLLDRNLQVGFIIADQNHDKALVRDKHWNKKNPDPLYSIDSSKTEIRPLVGSATRKTSIQAQPRNSITAANIGNDVVMIARIPMNTNEDAISLSNFDTKIQVRRSSRISSFDNSINNGGGSILGGARRKLSRFGKFKHQDSETGTNEFSSEMERNEENNDEEYVFNKSSVIKSSENSDWSKRHAPSMIKEEDDGYFNNAIDLVDELYLNKIDKKKTDLDEEAKDSINADMEVDLNMTNILQESHKNLGPFSDTSPTNKTTNNDQ